MNIAARRAGKTRSGRPGRPFACKRNRKPRTCRPRLTVNSGSVFFPRILDINALRADGESGSIMDSGARVLQSVLRASEPRPSESDAIGSKIQYAVRFADAMAAAIANDLSPRLNGIAATTKRTAAAVQARKQLDVNFST